MSELQVYSRGPLALSVCAPSGWDRERVQKEVNAIELCGTEQGWLVSDDKTFHGGEPMPCVCNTDPNRRHWLMDC